MFIIAYNAKVKGYTTALLIDLRKVYGIIDYDILQSKINALKDKY